MQTWLDALGVRLPILNAGMGLGIAGPALAAAVVTRLTAELRAAVA